MVLRWVDAGVRAPGGAAVEGTGERREGMEPSWPPPPLPAKGSGEDAGKRDPAFRLCKGEEKGLSPLIPTGAIEKVMISPSSLGVARAGAAE
jgi:hypothetical protein